VPDHIKGREEIMIQSVVHIVDDASWGGVNRLLECFNNAPQSFVHDRHKIMRIERGLKKSPAIDADVIVSHLSVCWKNIPFFSSLRAMHPETPLVHVEHSYSERFSALKVNNKDRFNDLMRLAMGLFDKVVAVSQPQAAWLKRRGFANPDQLVTISSCVSLAAFEAVATQRPEGQLTIGAIGRFHEQKGFDLLIDAFVAAAPSNTRLILIGDGPDRDMLIAKAKAHPQICFLPYTSDPAEAFAKCDVIAMPSRWEPYGLVALEAMAAKRPVICANVDGLKEHIANGATAIAENTIAGWRDQFDKLGSREAVARLSQGYGHMSAEWNFLDKWNKLVHELTYLEGSTQKAA
jgi:D-inositol-3-phosphate glycosyltransferase